MDAVVQTMNILFFILTLILVSEFDKEKQMTCDIDIQRKLTEINWSNIGFAGIQCAIYPYMFRHCALFFFYLVLCLIKFILRCIILEVANKQDVLCVGEGWRGLWIWYAILNALVLFVVVGFCFFRLNIFRKDWSERRKSTDWKTLVHVDEDDDRE